MADKESQAVTFTKETVLELLSLIGIEGEAKVEEVAQGEDKVIQIDIEADTETGLLIGTHGSTLNAIQVFLGMALRQKLGEWQRVVVNIGDWKEKQEEQLATLATQTASRAKSTGEPQRLYNLSASQRRVIHMSLADDSEIETVSEGEGEERHLIIKVKS